MRLPKLPRCFHEPWVRIGVQVSHGSARPRLRNRRALRRTEYCSSAAPPPQVAAGTLIILAACTPYTVWTALSLDPVVATPAVCLLLYYVHRLLSIGSGLSSLCLLYTSRCV